MKKNTLRGPIPDAVLSLGDVLSSLNLFLNQLSGCIPGAVSSLTKLSFLDLSDNRLSGYIPDAVSSLTKLDRLGMVKKPGVRPYSWRNSIVD